MFDFLRTSSEIKNTHDPFTEDGLKNRSRTQHSRGRLSAHYMFELDNDWKRVQEVKNQLFNLTLDPEFDKAMGSFIGMVMGDALGAPFEFSHYIASPFPQQDDLYMTDGLCQINFWMEGCNAFRLKVGQWTDDASMGFCLVDFFYLLFWF